MKEKTKNIKERPKATKKKEINSKTYYEEVKNIKNKMKNTYNK